MAQKDAHLVIGHLELISAGVFEQFQSVITEIVDRQNGVYALYSNDDLYYVGLARNLKARLRAHSRDRHKGLWDRFSVYLTNGDAHMKELESLMLRVIQPKGNRVKGKLRGSKDKRSELDRRIKEEQDLRRFGILGKMVTKKAKKRTTSREFRKREVQPPALGRTIYMKANYKGNLYRATLRPDGTVKLNGTIYSSLSASGVAITKRATNGRRFWRARNADKVWVQLRELGV